MDELGNAAERAVEELKRLRPEHVSGGDEFALGAQALVEGDLNQGGFLGAAGLAGSDELVSGDLFERTADVFGHGVLLVGGW